MYAPRGIGFSEVGDIEVVADGDDLHLFHLTLPNHDVVQHVVSRDGLRWEQLPPALWTGSPGDVDDDQIWTMSVTDDGADALPRYHMLYTALARAEDGRVQRVADATSNDLIHWTKTGNQAVAVADPRWYEATVAESGAVSFRDPKPVRANGRWYLAVCARTKDGPVMRRGAVALLVSDDLCTWEHVGPVIAPRHYWDLECPQIFEIGGTWYLTAGIMEDGTQRYWRADQVDGPYTVPADGGILAPQGHYAGRIVHWRGQDLYLCWHRPLGHHGPTLVDWATQRNTSGKFIPAPLVLTQRSDGSLAQSTFAGWVAYRDGSPTPLVPSGSTAFQAEPVATDDARWTLSPPEGTMDALATAIDHADLDVAGTLRLDAASGGLAFRMDIASGAGYFIELRAGSRNVTLRKLLLSRDRWSGKQWFAYTDYQRGELRQPFRRGDELPFRLLLSGPYIELSLGDEVVIATLSGEAVSGRFGFWVEDGSGAMSDVTAAPLRPIPNEPSLSTHVRVAEPAAPDTVLTKR